jgi:ribosome maturation protein Sdo1
MSKNLLVRLKKNGATLEVLTHLGSMKLYRDGKKKMEDILVIEEIYSNASKMEKAKSSEIKKVCETDNKSEAIKFILDNGEYALNQKEMVEMIAQKRGEILNYLNKYYQDPRGEKITPHPVERFDNALTKLKIKIEPTVPAEQQVKVMLKKLQEELPLRPMDPPHEMKFEKAQALKKERNGRR